MTLGRREYSEADMLRMQRDAEERVRDMQNRARIAVEEANNSNFGNNGSMASRNRNWNTGSGMRRTTQRRGQRPETSPSEPETEGMPEEPGSQEFPPEQESPPPHSEEAQKRTTMVEDIMGALNMDEDYLLVIGLLLILINQRADTTLILALAYLLI